MKFIGLDIFNSNVHFNGMVNFGTKLRGNAVGSVIVTSDSGDVQKSNSINLKKDTLALGTGNTRSFTLTREISNTGDGSDLIIQGGDGKGTDKPGGDLSLYGGASTGNTEGGEIYFYNTARSGSTSSTPNAHRTLMYTDSAEGELILSGLTAIRGVGENTLAFENDHDMKFVIDKDNDTGAGEHFLWLDYTAPLARLKDDETFTLYQSSTYKGFVFDAANHIIKAGDRATINSGGYDSTAGGANTAGVDLTIAGGAGTGTGAGGTIKLGTFPAGGSSLNVNTTYANIATFTEGGQLQLESTNTTVGNSAELKFKKDAADTEDGEVLGQITFYGEDEGNNQTQFAGIKASISESDETDEAGKLELQVAESDGTDTAMTTGLTLEGEHATDGQIDVTIAAGAASTTTIAGTLTMGSTAAMTNAGLLSVANQSNITGVGTISSGAWRGTSINTTYTDAKVTSVIAGDGIDVDSATGDVTVTAESASANPGVVELATTAEADSGTDTARAITAAGLKSHVDARFSYQYIALSMNSSTPADGDWMIASGNGIGNHLYNQNVGAGGTTPHNTDGSASQITISKNILSGGIIVPYDCTLVGFYAHSRASSNDQKALGLFTATATWNDYADITGYLRAYSAQDISAGPDTSYSVRPVQHSVLSINKALSAGDQMWPATRSVGGGAGGCITSMTIVLKTLIP